MLRVLLACLVVAPVLAQGMPPASRADMWHSPHNQKRLKPVLETLPAFKPTKLPDGSEEPPKAPWPFVVYVYDNPSKGSEKLEEKVFSDTRFILATQAVRFVKIKPEVAIEKPYLASVQGVKDPTLIFVDCDFKVKGVLNSVNEFTDRKVLAAMADVADDSYEVKLGAFLGRYVDVLKEGEKLWKLEQKMDELREKAAAADKAKAQKYDQEADEIEKELKPAMEALGDTEIEVQDSLKRKGADVKETVPTTYGSGKNRRELTPQEIEALEAFNEFKKDQNPIVRAAAVEDLGMIDSAVMVEAILKAANDVDMRVVEAAGKGLGRMKSDEAVGAMLEGLKSSNSKARIAAILGFAALTRPCPEAVRPIAALAKGGGDEQRRAAVMALHNLKDPAGAAPLIDALDDSEEGLRVLAAEALGDMHAVQAAPALIGKLEASDWSLRKAAIEALAKLRVKESIEPLLKRFETEEGLLEETLHDALVAITGQDFLFNRESWRKWWDKWGSGFRVPTDEEIAEAKRKAAEAMKGYHDPRKRKYHTIETLSRKMVFIIDISSSMKDSIVIPPYAPKELQEQFPDRVKIEIAKKELIDLLATLDSNVYFNIITFAGKVEPWQDNLVSGSMRTAAIKFVAKLKALEPPRGSKNKRASSGDETKTNTYGALMAAFGVYDEAVPNWKARSQVDTIFFVTDGVPTVGTITDVPKVIDAVTELNRTKGVIIHVITFDKQDAIKLGPLATRNGGQIVVRGYTGD